MTHARAKSCVEQVFDLVRRDAAFLPGFIPTYFELELGRSSEQLLEYAGVPVRGKVDRVDVDAEGNAVIIDYKLSGLSAGYGFGRDDELPQRIQTDIYATLVERHFAALGTPLHVVGSVYRSYAKNALRGVYARGIPWVTPSNYARTSMRCLVPVATRGMMRISRVSRMCSHHASSVSVRVTLRRLRSRATCASTARRLRFAPGEVPDASYP